MKKSRKRFWLYKRSRTYYLWDTLTGKRESLGFADPGDARRLLQAREEAEKQPQLGLAIGRAYLASHDPGLIQRSWSDVMAVLCTHGRESSQTRCRRAMEGKVFDLIRQRKIIETSSGDLLKVLEGGGAATNNYLRRLHNLALGLGWLAWPILGPKLWPKWVSKPKRAITWREHQQIVEAEGNTERRLYYELLWEIGASQTDAASLCAENIHWEDRVLIYCRKKLPEESKPAQMFIGARLELILRRLPSEGPLFPHLVVSSDNARAAEFYRRCKLLKITGVSLHSYRYSWAERARQCGYPERFAQEALGHNSKAVHRAYAKRAQVVIPPLDAYEKDVGTANPVPGQSAPNASKQQDVPRGCEAPQAVNVDFIKV